MVKSYGLLLSFNSCLSLEIQFPSTEIISITRANKCTQKRNKMRNYCLKTPDEETKEKKKRMSEEGKERGKEQDRDKTSKCKWCRCDSNHPCCQITSCNNNHFEMPFLDINFFLDENGKCMLLKLDKRHEWRTLPFSFRQDRFLLFLFFFICDFVVRFHFFPLFGHKRMRGSNVEILSFFVFAFLKKRIWA